MFIFLSYTAQWFYSSIASGFETRFSEPIKFGQNSSYHHYKIEDRGLRRDSLSKMRIPKLQMSLGKTKVRQENCRYKSTSIVAKLQA